MSVRRHRRPRGALLAFLAVTLQVLFPFFLAGEIAHANEPGAIAIICSSLGAGRHHDSSNTPTPNLADHCSICTTLAAAQGFAPPAAPPLPSPATIAAHVFAAADSSAPARLAASPYQSRGPPPIA